MNYQIILLIVLIIISLVSAETSSAGGKENWDFWCVEGSTDC